MATRLIGLVGLTGLACALGPGCSPQAQAGTASANVTVQVTVTSACTISTGILNFGTQSAFTIDNLGLLASTSFSVTCTNGTPYAIGMDSGLYGVSAAERRLKLSYSTFYIAYVLGLNSSLQYWETAASSTTCTTPGDCYLGTGIGAAQSITVYGWILPSHGVPYVGNYSDTVTMTIIY